MRSLALFLILLFSQSLSAQTLFSFGSIEDACKAAVEEGTFVIIDFHGSFATSSQRMENFVWSLDTVQAVQQNFVNMREDITTSSAVAQTFGIKSIPALIILDGMGRAFFRREGAMRLSQVLDLLDQFPKGMQEVYAAEQQVQENPEDFTAHLDLAHEFQIKAREAKYSIANQLAGLSDGALDKAWKALVSEGEETKALEERIRLMRAENFLLKGRAKRALKELVVIGDELQATNVARSCYIKGMAFRRMNLPTLAQESYECLLQAENNEEFLVLYEGDSLNHLNR